MFVDKTHFNRKGNLLQIIYSVFRNKFLIDEKD